MGVHWRWWASGAAMLAVACLDVYLPASFVVLAFLWVPVVLSAAFAVPRGTLALATWGAVLALVVGWSNGYYDEAAYWTRLVAMALIALLSIYLSQITAEKSSRLLQLSTTDALTGLANRRLLLDRLEVQLRIRHRTALVAVLFIDLDRFKLVNSLHNHQGGDEVLQEVARRFSSTVRSEDTLARFGGDEFVVACPSIRDASEVPELCSRLIASLRAPIMVADGVTVGAVTVGATIGAAIAGPRTSIDAEELIEAADVELLRLKASDPGGFRVMELA